MFWTKIEKRRKLANLPKIKISPLCNHGNNAYFWFEMGAISVFILKIRQNPSVKMGNRGKG
ncbi:MAG: hypothetical protein MUE81_21185 [Thermoflexibacter sp.]|nr:hypothetical protein [Thermoflexibacter sp.]